MNLIQGLHEQMARAHDLQAAYDELESGWFAAGRITEVLAAAELSIASGDTVAMISAYKALEALE